MLSEIKADRERYILYDLTYMCNIKSAEFINTDNKLMMASGSRWRTWGRGGSVMYSVVTPVNVYY